MSNEQLPSNMQTVQIHRESISTIEIGIEETNDARQFIVNPERDGVSNPTARIALDPDEAIDVAKKLTNFAMNADSRNNK